jgi:hypothetical protein
MNKRTAAGSKREKTYYGYKHWKKRHITTTSTTRNDTPQLLAKERMLNWQTV